MSLFTTDQVNIQNVSVLTTQTATVEGALAVGGGASITGATSITGVLSASGKVAALSASVAVAGGAQAIQVGSAAALGIYFGSGAPTIQAAQGSLYIRTDGSSTSTRLYVNTDGAATWTNFTSAA
jgi:hypothetical protein